MIRRSVRYEELAREGRNGIEKGGELSEDVMGGDGKREEGGERKKRRRSEP